MKKHLLLAPVALAAGLTLASAAQGAVIVGNWTFDLSGIDGLPTNTVLTNVQQMTFFGVAHAHTNDVNNNFLPDPGEYSSTDGHLAATGVIDAITHAPNVHAANGQILTRDFEITFDFSVDSRTLSPAPTSLFKHIAPTNPHAVTDGLLDIWVDSTVDSNASTGDGYTDGTKIATFEVLAGDGGTFTPLTFDGADDATFRLVSALPGVIFDTATHTDLTTLTQDVLLAITDSNFDADPTQVGGFSLAAPTNWGSYFTETGAGTPIDFFAYEDGSYRLGTQAIPEPSTIVLLGLGLVGGAFVSRRRLSD